MNLYKQYGQLVAVNHLSVGVTDQECFGLLGQNGAGKTTTFKMLTGLEMMDGGNAYVKGLDIKNNLKQVCVGGGGRGGRGGGVVMMCTVCLCVCVCVCECVCVCVCVCVCECVCVCVSVSVCVC